MRMELGMGIPGIVMIYEIMNYEDGWKSFVFRNNIWSLYTNYPSLSSRDAFVS